MREAKVFDITPAQLRRTAERQQAAAQPGSILDDLADGIEAVHQLANLAHFTERPRALIFAVATAAHKAGEDFVELYDAELAELQGCSERTVRRQRADYLKEARAKGFGFVEIIEGEYDRTAGQNAPTRYRFHVGGQINEAVELARQTPGWAEMKRQQQRATIARVCEEVFHTIPDARRQGRRGKRPRLATAEIKSRLKAAETNLDAAREMAAKLSEPARAELLDEDGDEQGSLRDRLLRMRNELDRFLVGNFSQEADTPEVDRGGGQVVLPPPVLSAPPAEGQPAAPAAVRTIKKNTRTATPPPPEPEHSPEAVASWEQLEGRLSRPRTPSTVIPLRTPEESPPAFASDDGRERGTI